MKQDIQCLLALCLLVATVGCGNIKIAGGPTVNTEVPALPSRTPRPTFTPQPQATDTPGTTNTPAATDTAAPTETAVVIPTATRKPVVPTNPPAAPTLRPTLIPQPTKPPAPTQPPQPTSIPPTPQPAFAFDTLTPQCFHAGQAFIEGIVYGPSGSPSDRIPGVKVRMSYAPNGPNPVTVTTGDDGKYTHVVNGSGPAAGQTRYVWIADGAGNPLSDASRGGITFNDIRNSDDPKACWRGVVDFKKVS